MQGEGQQDWEMVCSEVMALKPESWKAYGQTVAKHLERGISILRADPWVRAKEALWYRAAEVLLPHLDQIIKEEI